MRNLQPEWWALSLGVAVVLGIMCSASSAQGGPASRPKPNPFLAAESYAIAHFDSAQSDVMPYPAPRGTFRVDLQKSPRVVSGPVNIFTAVSTSPDYMWAFSSQGVA